MKLKKTASFSAKADWRASAREIFEKWKKKLLVLSI
jgi:hypothetical protein